MYTDYFGFRDDPFSATSDVRFFFETPSHQDAYANLYYGIHEHKGLLLLTGEAGTGKTTLLRRLIKNLDRQIQCIFVDNTQWTFEELLSLICTDLGLSTPETGRLQKIRALKEFLQERVQVGGTGVVLIDEAQNLEDHALENLRLLLNLETPSHKLLQIVLAGQPELKLKLAQTDLRQLKQRIAIQCQLSCLQEREVGPFIRHRLRMVECDRPELFPPEVIQCIAAYSHGIPRLVNVLCDNALLSAYRADKKTVSAQMIEEVAQALELDLELDLGQELTPAPEVGRPPDSRLKAGGELVGGREARQSASALPESEESELPTTPMGHRLPERTGPATKRPAAVQVWPGLYQNRLLRRGGVLVGLLLLIGVGVVFAPQVLTPKPRVVVTAFTAETTQMPKAQAEAPARPPSEPKFESKFESKSPAQQPRPLQITEPIADPPSAVSPAGEWKTQPVVIEPGTTIYEIVLQAYGEYGPLALDLLKEFNPHIQDFDIVRVGESLLLPPLTRETLLRKQADGSYRLILASFDNVQQARLLRQTMRRRGFSPEMSSQRVSKRLVLHRVAITGLQDPQTIEQAWDVARSLNTF